jgi:uncharacterized protein involved in outer membrane biogenesis
MRRAVRIAFCATICLATCLPRSATGQQPADPEPPRAEQPRYLRTPFSFRRVDAAWLAGWLRRFGIQLPGRVDGRISARLDVEWPWGALGSARAYRIDGEVTSDRLALGPVVLRNVAAAVRYRGGEAELVKLEFDLDQPGAATDTPTSARVRHITGSATVQLVPLGDISIRGAANQVPLASASRLMELPDLDLRGTLSAEVQAHSDFESARSVRGWRLDGRLSAEDLQGGRSPTLQVPAASFSLREGRFLLERLQMTGAGVTVEGRARIELFGRFAWQGSLRLDRADLQQLTAGLGVAQLRAHGGVTGAAEVTGTVQPPSWQGQAHLAAEQIRVEDARLQNGRVELQLRGTPDQEAGWTDLAAHTTAEGRLAVREIGWRHLSLENVESTYRYAASQFRLDGLRAQLLGGTLRGTSRLAWDNATPSQLRVNWEGVRMEEAFPPAARSPQAPLRGVSEGQLDVSAAPGRLAEWRNLQGQLRAEIAQGILLDMPLQEARLQARLEQQRLTLETFAGQLPSGPISASGDVHVAEPYPFRLQYRLPALPVQQLWDIAAPHIPSKPLGTISGQVSASGQASGALGTRELERAQGELAAEQLSVERIVLDRLRARYGLTPREARVSGLSAQLLGGKVTGSGTWSREPRGQAAAKIRWDAVDLGALAARWANLPLRVRSASQGSLEWAAPGASWSDWRKAELNFRAGLRDLLVNGQAAGSLSLTLENRPREWAGLRYAATGTLLGGVLEAQGRLPHTGRGQHGETENPTEPGQFALRDVQLDQLSRIMFPTGSGTFGGRFSTAGQVMLDDPAAPRISAQVDVSQLVWLGQPIATGLMGSVELDRSRLELREFSGRVADGQVRASGIFSLSDRRPGSLEIILDRASLGQLVGLVVPDWQSSFTGRSSLRLRATGRSRWQASGTMTGERPAYGKVQLRRLEVPFRAAWHVPSGRYSVRSHDVRASMPRGHLTGRFETRQFTTGLSLESQWRFHRVDLKTLISQVGGSSLPGSGQLSGRLALSGRRIASFRDLSGRLSAQLRDARGQGLPLAAQMQRHLAGIGNVTSTVFREGDLEATLGQGSVRVEQLSLSSPALRVYARGRYTPISDRVAMDVTVGTGQPLADRVAAQVVLSQLALATPPTAVIGVANELLANRLIHLRVNGTLQRPTISVRPAATLGWEALGFFLR